ncbi:MAG: TetR/AcrR family transcriptional regulator [Fimbriimonadaceae bacterium]|nr:TetR/AcrR family transcriptional regulator [Fimbriimonadaceae bacterium]
MSDAGGRGKLLAAARNLFPRSSYAEVGVAQLLEEAGVKAPTLYYHFGDKEGLFVAHVEQELGSLGAHLRLLAQTHNSLQAALADLASALAEFTGVDLDGALEASRRMGKPSNQERIQESYVRNVFEPIASLLQSAMDRGEMKREPAGRLVVLFQSGALQLCSGRSDLAGRAPSDWWAETFVRAFAAR